MSKEPVLPSVAFGWYYFRCKATNRRRIFANQAELDRLRELLVATLARYGAHIHFADVRPYTMQLGLRAGERSITQTIGVFCHTWAREANRIRGESGPLFRPHALHRLVEPGETFISLGRYIHHAPELGDKSSEGPDGESTDPYWSTKELYVSGGRMPGVDAGVIRRIAALGSRDLEVQRRASAAAFDRSPTEEEIELFTKGSPEDSRFVGSAEFIAARCRELNVKRHPRTSHFPNAEAEMYRIASRLIEAFRRLGDDAIPSVSARKWKSWEKVVTLENVCSESRKQPLPILRGLVASRMRSRGIPQRLIEPFLHSKPRTFAAGRRQHYQMKFKALFGRPYEDLFRMDGRILWVGLNQPAAPPRGSRTTGARDP